MGLGLDILSSWLCDFSECWLPTCKMWTSVSQQKIILRTKKQAPGRHEASEFVVSALNKKLHGAIYMLLGSPMGIIGHQLALSSSLSLIPGQMTLGIWVSEMLPFISLSLGSQDRYGTQ